LKLCTGTISNVAADTGQGNAETLASVKSRPGGAKRSVGEERSKILFRLRAA